MTRPDPRTAAVTAAADTLAAWCTRATRPDGTTLADLAAAATTTTRALAAAQAHPAPHDRDALWAALDRLANLTRLTMVATGGTDPGPIDLDTHVDPDAIAGITPDDLATLTADDTALWATPNTQTTDPHTCTTRL